MKEKVTVIGAGISGSAFAHFAATNGYKVNIYEKATSGGCIQSICFSNNYYFELGGHTLTYKYNTILEIIEYYKKTDQIVPINGLRFEGYTRGQFHSIFKNVKFGQLFISLLKRSTLSKTNQSIKSYYSAILGDHNYDHLFHYLFSAILCQNPDHFPAEMLFRKRRPNKKYPKKFSLKNGIEQFIEIILQNPEIDYKNKSEITRITKTSEHYELWSADQKIDIATKIGFSCPPDVAAFLLKDIEPGLSKMLHRIRVIKIETVLVHVKNKEALKKRKKSIIGFEQPFYSAIFHQINEEKYYVFYFKENEYKEDEKIKAISDVFSIEQHEIRVLATKISRLPAVTVENLELLVQIEKDVAGKPIFFPTNYIEGLSIEDCCLRAKKEADRLVTMN